MHPEPAFNGCYEEAENWNGYPHFTNRMGSHLYWHDYDGFGYWKFSQDDDAVDTGKADGGSAKCSSEWYDFKCAYSNEDSMGGSYHEFRGVGTIEIINNLDGHFGLLDPRGETCEGMWVTHPSGFYSGYYWASYNWNGMPHFINNKGAHFYWLDKDDFGFWQFDENLQDITDDMSSGGHMMCEGEWWDCPYNYDENGYAEYEYSVGMVSFQIDYNCY